MIFLTFEKAAEQRGGFAVVLQELTDAFCRSFQKTGQETKYGEMIRQEIQERDHHFVLAYRDEALVGFVSWRQDGHDDHGLFELYHVGSIFPESGVILGPRLIEMLIQEIDRTMQRRGSKTGVRMLWLRTALGSRARALYRRFGFEYSGGQLPDHWGDGRAEAVFTLHVPRWREKRAERLARQSTTS